MTIKKYFSDQVRYRKQARIGAILWTLLIFFLCFLPGDEIPDLKIPLIDKWAHFILFGIYTFLWLLATSLPTIKKGFAVFISAVVLGWLVEYIQGAVKFLHRSQDNMDTLADSVGGLLGVLLFFSLQAAFGRKNS